ncbi:hypothetical protein [Comamonas sp. 4034]|uniref:hypothetical protein n=1 Tax=Comamonas sp. 4034 TaxID=3156455 RepID=UPI003D1EB968
MQDYLVCPPVNEIYQSSKNLTWRKQVLDKRRVIFQFLKDNNLILIDPFLKNGEVNMELSLMRSHLTDVGDEMFNKIIPNWQKARDKDGNLENVSILKNGLNNIKEKNSIE